MNATSDPIRTAYDVLARGLRPFVQREMESRLGSAWKDHARQSFRDHRGATAHDDPAEWDAQALLTIIWDQWNACFRHKLGFLERSLVSELRAFRNQWAHQQELSADDAYRILDSAERLLKGAGVPEEAAVLRSCRNRLLTESDEELQRLAVQSQVPRLPLETLVLYALCAAAVLFQMWLAWDTRGWFMAILVVATFAYLAFERIRVSRGSRRQTAASN